MSMALQWPVEGGRDLWPVYSDEADHLSRGEKPSWDLCDQEGVALHAIADGAVVAAPYDPHINDGYYHAGQKAILECEIGGRWFRFHYTHLPPADVRLGKVQRGEIIGHVGYSGSGFDGRGPRPLFKEEAHLHFYAEEWTDGRWQRVEDIAALFQETGENQNKTAALSGVISEGDNMTDEQKNALTGYANLLENWAKLRRERDKVAESFGYGIDDSLDGREADELQSVVDGIRGLTA